MAGTRDYPLAGVLGAGNLIHHARLVGLLGKRIETRCGLEGDKTDRDGGIWCPDCLALERSKADAHDAGQVPLRQRSIPDQLDYFGDKLGGLLDGANLDRDMLIVIGAAVVNLGAIAAQLRKQGELLAAATARAEKAETERDEVEAVRGHQRAEVDLLAASNIDLRHRREKAEALVAELRTRRDHCVAREITAKIEARLLRREVAELRDAMGVDALQGGRSEPVERSETSGGIGTASNSSTGTAGLSAACGNKYSYHVCFLPAGHDGDHRDDRYWRWPTHLGTWTNDDATEDGQHG